MDKLPLMVVDLLLIALAVWGSFALRLGAEADTFEHARLYALRVAPWLYFGALIVFRFYNPVRPLWQTAGLSVLAGTTALAGFLYIGWQAGWLEGFSRVILFLIAGLSFTLLYGSRLLLRFLRPRPVLAEKQV